MNEGFEKIFTKFKRNMEYSGIFLLEPRDGRWDSPSFQYSVQAGVYKPVIPESELEKPYFFHSHATCFVEFRGDRSTEETREREDYEMTLPGRIDGRASSLQAMTDGVRLLTTLESWAYNHGKLKETFDSSSANLAIVKRFVLNKDLLS